jgi:hypothetical protein
VHAHAQGPDLRCGIRPPRRPRSAIWEPSGSHLGAIALRTGKKLTWDRETERFTGPDAAAGIAHLAREMRKPYDYDFVS